MGPEENWVLVWTLPLGTPTNSGKAGGSPTLWT